jgi:hypothetical protein
VAALLTLPEAKEALGVQDTGDETFIAALVDGITAVIEHEVGAVTPREVVMDLRGCGHPIALSESNVLEIVSASNAAGNIPVTGMTVDSSGILRGSLPGGDWQLRVRIGMDPVPPAIKAAAREVLKEAWAIKAGPDNEAHKRPFLISHRTMVWLEPYRTGPGFA